MEQKKGFVIFIVVIVSILVAIVVFSSIYNLVQKQQTKSSYQLFKTFQDPVSNEFTNLSDSIFVSIPSFRDGDLINTVADLYDKALNANRVFVGICEQNAPTDSKFYEDFHKLLKQRYPLLKIPFENIKLHHMDASEATGPMAARVLIETTLYSEQKYWLQIDSHMMFMLDWDQRLIDNFEEVCRATRKQIDHDFEEIEANKSKPNSNKVILTMYPSNFNPNDRQPIADIFREYNKKNHLDDNHTLGSKKQYYEELSEVLCFSGAKQDIPQPMCLESFSADGFPEFVMSTQYTTHKELSIVNQHSTMVPEVRPCLFWSACFSFTLASTHLQVPYVNLPYVFIGEEFLMAALYWTHGYRFYLPKQMVVRHRWSREGRPLFFDNYTTNSNLMRIRNASYQELKHFFDIVSPVGQTTGASATSATGETTGAATKGVTQLARLLGTSNTLAEYLQWCGINLNAKSSKPRTKLGLVENPSSTELLFRFGSLANFQKILKTISS